METLPCSGAMVSAAEREITEELTRRASFIRQRQIQRERREHHACDGSDCEWQAALHRRGHDIDDYEGRRTNVPCVAAEPAGRAVDRRPGETHHADAHADGTGPGDSLRPRQRPGRGVRAVEPRPNSGAPPHLAGCGHPDVMSCDLTVLPEQT